MMSSKVLVGVLAAAIALTGSTAVADTTHSGSEDFVAVEGQLLGAAGHPTAGEIQVFAWPNDVVTRQEKVGDEVDVILLDTVPTDVLGKFAVTLDPREIPRSHYNDDGRVHLELRGEPPVDTASFASRAVTVQWIQLPTGDSGWIDPLYAVTIDELLEDGRSIADMAVYAVESQHLPLEDPVSDPTRIYEGAGGGSGYCYTTRVGTDAWYSHWVDVWTNKGIDSYEEYGSHHSSAFGVAVRSSDEWSWSAGGERTAKSGFEFTWPYEDGSRWLQIHMEYGKYKQECRAENQSNTWEQTTYYWRPIRDTGGTKTIRTDHYPSWGGDNCVGVGAGTWRRFRSDGNVTRFSGGVKTRVGLGINLSFRSNYSHERAIGFRTWKTSEDDTTADYIACGNNDWPSYASRVRARW